MSLTIEGPSGQRGKQIGDERRFEIQPKSSANFVAALSPFAIKKFGICNFIVVLDGNTHHLPFELRLVESGEIPPAALDQVRLPA